AEPTALAACTESPRGATAYVTLEPCCHTDKKTPPCAPRLIEAGIARVVFGCLDPTQQVDGKGVAMLRRGGIEVSGPVMESEARQLIAPYIARVLHGRPYVTTKWAQTADGKVAGHLGKTLRISNDRSMRLMHELRARCDAIAVGTNTVLNDDPLLTARNVERPRPLLRVVLSNTLNIPLQSRLVTSAHQDPLLVYCSKSSFHAEKPVIDALAHCGVEVVAVADHESRFSFADVLSDLHRRNVTHLLVEPGPTLTRYMFARGQADRVWVFRSSARIDDPTAPSAPTVDYDSTGELDLGGDVLTEFLNPASACYFARVESADFVIAQQTA
ncbi:MAG: bifunctional diaminohydroxyphosphoribosylaminopyrimidine deaminase/5-amino-6-(5-phosphoribosylamino)uracil reductase RibD, partial [Tepidisphaeraceae bacterium]